MSEACVAPGVPLHGDRARPQSELRACAAALAHLAAAGPGSSSSLWRVVWLSHSKSRQFTWIGNRPALGTGIEPVGMHDRVIPVSSGC